MYSEETHHANLQKSISAVVFDVDLQALSKISFIYSLPDNLSIFSW